MVIGTATTSCLYRTSKTAPFTTYTTGDTITLNKDEYVQFKELYNNTNNDTSWNTENRNLIQFVMTGTFNSKGTVYYGKNSAPHRCVFARLFEDCTSLLTRS